LASLPALHGPRVRRWAGPGGQKMIPPPSSDPPAPPEQTFLRHVPAAASGDPPPAISKAGKEKARPASSSDPPWRGPPPRPAAVSPPTGRPGDSDASLGEPGFSSVFYPARGRCTGWSRSGGAAGREGDSDPCARPAWRPERRRERRRVPGESGSVPERTRTVSLSLASPALSRISSAKGKGEKVKGPEESSPLRIYLCTSSYSLVCWPVGLGVSVMCEDAAALLDLDTCRWLGTWKQGVVVITHQIRS